LDTVTTLIKIYPSRVTHFHVNVTWVSGSILQIEPDTQLNLIAFHPQQSLYLVSNQNIAGEI
jgi:hypothetical protein